MKLLYNGMEITCTPDEFEELVIRGLLPGRAKLININDNDEWISSWKHLPKEMTQPVVVCGCPFTATSDPYIQPSYTSDVTISQEQLNKLNTIVNKDEQST